MLWLWRWLFEPISKPIAEPRAEPRAEPGAEPGFTEPGAEPCDEPRAEPRDEPGAEPGTKRGAQPFCEPIAKSIPEPLGRPVAEPIAELPEPGAGPDAGRRERRLPSLPCSFVDSVSDNCKRDAVSGLAIFLDASKKESWTVACLCLFVSMASTCYFWNPDPLPARDHIARSRPCFRPLETSAWRSVVPLAICFCCYLLVA